MNDVPQPHGRTDDSLGRANVQVCPICKAQNALPPNKRRKTVRCSWCTTRFPILHPAGMGQCAHCGVPVAAPKWIVGRTVLCPDCKGGIKLRWDAEP